MGVRHIRIVKVLLLLVMASYLSWLSANSIFSWRTLGGSLYESTFVSQTDDSFKRIENVANGRDKYRVHWNAERRTLAINAYVDAVFLFEVSVSITGYDACTSLLADEASDALTMRWEFRGTSIDTIGRLFGGEQVSGCKRMIGFSPSSPYSPFARNVEFDVPIGAIPPQISLLIERGLLGAGVGSERKYLDALGSRISGEITNILRLNEIDKDLATVSFLYGTIQFYSLVVSIACIFLLLISFLSRWARGAAESLMNLIPFVGFFGTLLGMGGALKILGIANLSDPISKAINLGPIGSNLALAIETTKFALVCFGVVVLVALVRDSLANDCDDKLLRS